jgi:hypothetical protein
LLFGPAGAVGALGGAAAGLTVGATGDALSDAISHDRDDQFLRDAISGIEPGQTVLLAELDEEDEESADRIDAAVTRRGGRVFRTSREVSQVEEVRHHVERKLTRKAASIEEDIAADEAERDHMHGLLKEGDVGIAKITTINQQSEYDVYANSQGPASTRPNDE